jgi:hypothetical protein
MGLPDTAASRRTLGTLGNAKRMGMENISNIVGGMDIPFCGLSRICTICETGRRFEAVVNCADHQQNGCWVVNGVVNLDPPSV